MKWRRRAAVLLSEVEIARRQPVWSALSELFLDTELDEADHRRLRDVLAASGYPSADLRDILEREVFPVFGGNLLSVAGEWAGWREEDVLDEMLAFLAGKRPARVGRLARWWLRDHLAEQWARIDPAGP